MLLRQQSQVAHETTDCIVGYNALFQRNADIIKDLDNFHMVLLQLVKDKKCIVFETEKHQKVTFIPLNILWFIQVYYKSRTPLHAPALVSLSQNGGGGGGGGGLVQLSKKRVVVLLSGKT